MHITTEYRTEAERREARITRWHEVVGLAAILAIAAWAVVLWLA